jgi:hypothetical protein
MRTRLDGAARYMGIWLAAGLLILVPGVALLLVEWLGLTVPQSVGVGAAVVIGFGLLLILMASVGLAFSGAAGPDTDAFGLPEGSVRALIAMAVLVAFVGLVVYVLGTILTDEAERSAAAQTVIGILGTLVAAVSAFYFGANSVKSGAAVVASLSGPAPLGPEAMTKGSNDTHLVGIVSPHGLETNWYFEYTTATADAAPANYEAHTPVRTVPAGDEPVLVSEPLPPGLITGHWFRIVAFNPRGMARGNHQRIGGP